MCNQFNSFEQEDEKEKKWLSAEADYLLINMTLNSSASLLLLKCSATAWKQCVNKDNNNKKNSLRSPLLVITHNNISVKFSNLFGGGI